MNARLSLLLVRTRLAVAVMLSLSSTAFAGGVEELRAFVQKSQSARGEFSQSIARKISSKEALSSGTFSFARPAKFRWEIAKPSYQLLLGDGESVYFFDKDLNQVTARKSAEALGSTPAGILFGGGLSALDANFTLEEAGVKEKLSFVNALPKGKDSGFERMQIALRAGLPETIEVLDVLGNRTLITLRNVQLGAKTAPTEFTFSLPQGADLIRQ